MRKAVGLFLLLSAAACSGGDEGEYKRQTQDLKTFDATEAASADVSASAPGATPQPPNVGPTAAPGVAFNYRYAFRLPAQRVGEVQEQHAQACEKLGVENCRITEMNYRLVGEDDVEAHLAFKLSPELARKFGRDGIEAVKRAEGLLTAAQITGEDVGTQVEQGQRNQAELEQELRRIEQQLARAGLGSRERAELQAQAQSLRASLRGGQQAQTARRAQLATTPMVFRYEAGETDRTLNASLRRGFEAFLSSLGAVLVALVYLLPWALAALLGFVVWRWLRRRLFRRDGLDAAQDSAVTPPAA